MTYVQDMDQSCISSPHVSDAYEKGVEEFLQFACRNVNVSRVEDRVRMRCPCVN